MKFTNCDPIQSAHWKVLTIERKGKEHVSPIDTVYDVTCSLKYSTAWHTLFESTIMNTLFKVNTLKESKGTKSRFSLFRDEFLSTNLTKFFWAWHWYKRVISWLRVCFFNNYIEKKIKTRHTLMKTFLIPPSPLWKCSKNSSILVTPSVPKRTLEGNKSKTSVFFSTLLAL